MSALRHQHQQKLDSVAKKHGEALQLHQQKADRELAEQSQALVSSQKALEDAVAASKQASQVRYCFSCESGTMAVLAAELRTASL